MRQKQETEEKGVLIKNDLTTFDSFILRLKERQMSFLSILQAMETENPDVGQTLIAAHTSNILEKNGFELSEKELLGGWKGFVTEEFEYPPTKREILDFFKC